MSHFIDLALLGPRILRAVLDETVGSKWRGIDRCLVVAAVTAPTGQAVGTLRPFNSLSHFPWPLLFLRPWLALLWAPSPCLVFLGLPGTKVSPVRVFGFFAMIQGFRFQMGIKRKGGAGQPCSFIELLSFLHMK